MERAKTLHGLINEIWSSMKNYVVDVPDQDDDKTNFEIVDSIIALTNEIYSRDIGQAEKIFAKELLLTYQKYIQGRQRENA